MAKNSPQYGQAMTLRRLLEIVEARGDNLEEVMDLPLVISITDYYGNYERVSVGQDWPRCHPKHNEYKGEIALSIYLKEKSLRTKKK